MSYTASDLAQIVRETRRPYMTGRPMAILSNTNIDLGSVRGRDSIWDRRRDQRHRRAIPYLPKKLMELAGDRLLELAHRDVRPGWYVEYLKQRLGVNAAQIECKGYGDANKTEQARVQKVEDWLRGVNGELDPIGLYDSKLRDHQSCDGIGFAELEFLPKFIASSQRGMLSDDDYLKAVDKERRQYGLPYRMNVPDARSLYWAPIDVSQGLKLMVKVTDTQLISIQNKWLPVGLRLSMRGEYEQGKAELGIDPVLFGQEQPPSPTPAEMGAMVRFVYIATEHDIYHCVVPVCLVNGAAFPDDADGVMQLELIKAYKNPIGRVPFFPATARMSSDPDPAFMYQGLALEKLELAEEDNQLMTIRKLRAFLEAEKPWIIRNMQPDQAMLKSLPDIRPGFMELPYGKEIDDLPNVSAPDLQALINDLKETDAEITLSLSSASKQGAIGASTPAWALNLRNEESMGLYKEANDARANTKRDLLLAIAQCTRDKHATDGPVYVRTLTRAKKNPERGRVDLEVGITDEDLSTPFRLEVFIRSETLSQRASHNELGRRLWKEDGRISDETYDTEWALIDDPITEEKRRDRERIRKSLGDPALVAREIVRQVARAPGMPPVYATAVDLVLGPPIIPPEETAALVDEEHAQPLPGDSRPPPYPVSPGMGMSPSQPQPAPMPTLNGAQPYG